MLKPRSNLMQRGFTLIELVVVIVILGVLAAFAVPKFMGLEVQARISALNAMAGTVRSTSTMAYSAWLAQGNGGNTVTIQGVNQAVAFGYPTRASLPNMIQDFTPANSGFNYAAGTGLFTKVGALTPATCSFSYTAATNANTPPVISTPVTTGC